MLLLLRKLAPKAAGLPALFQMDQFNARLIFLCGTGELHAEQSAEVDSLPEDGRLKPVERPIKFMKKICQTMASTGLQ